MNGKGERYKYHDTNTVFLLFAYVISEIADFDRPREISHFVSSAFGIGSNVE